MFEQVEIERDPTIDELTSRICKQMSCIIETECPKPSSFFNSSGIKFVSFEDALKELLTQSAS